MVNKGMRHGEAAVLAFCVAALTAALLIGSRWPLVGDSVLMHYVVWLTRHGFAPYRDIAEMNLPMSYLSEGLAMRVFGAGSVGWRLYDGALTLGVVVLCRRLLRGRGAAAGVLAGTLFAAVHLQDGLGMAGQRDLLVAVLQLLSGLALLRAVAPLRPVSLRDGAVHSVMATWFALAAALGMAAVCIKPPALLFVAAAVVWAWWVVRAGRGAAQPGAGWKRLKWTLPLSALLGSLLPVLLCLAYLWRFHAVGAFVTDLHGLIAYHASLERRSVGFLLGHVWSPVLPFLAIAAVGIFAGQRLPWTRAEVLFGIAAASGLVSYVVQGKGFPYQRYPFLAWLLLLCVSRMAALLQGRETRMVRKAGAVRGQVVAGAALLCAVVLTVVFLVRASRFSHINPYAELRTDLLMENAPVHDGRVQCLDTAGPCIGALYEERLTQSTGFLYDCYLLDGSRAVVQQQRALFEREWQQRPPALVVLTDSNCFTGPRTFAKYGSWPWMQAELARYTTVIERHPDTPLRLWSRPERPYAYRILRRVEQPERVAADR